MNKKILILLFTCICIFGMISFNIKERNLENVRVIYANTDYNAQTGNTPPSYSGNSCGNSVHCEAWGQRNLNVLATLYYFKSDGSRQKLASLFVSNYINMFNVGSNTYNDYMRAAGQFCAARGCNYYGGYYNDFYLNFSSYFNGRRIGTVTADELRTYFLNNVNLWMSLMGGYNSMDRLNLPSQDACDGCDAQYGYRLVIEPVLEFSHRGTRTLATPIELAKLSSTLDPNLTNYNTVVSNNGHWDRYANYFNTKFVDVRISPGSSFSTSQDRIARDALANDYLGNGMHIIDFMDSRNYSCPDGTKEEEVTSCVSEYVNNGGNVSMAQSTCVSQLCEVTPPSTNCWGEVVTDGNPAVCNNYDQNNIGTFSERYVQNCRNTANQYGNPEEYLVDGTCRLYCLETAAQSFPGNVANALSKGTILVWPTSVTNTISLSKNIYPISFSGNRKCTLVMDGSDEDIYENESPIDRYNNYYDYVINNWYRRETTSSVRNSHVASFSHTQLRWDDIRQSYNGQWALSQNSCRAYYADTLNQLNSSLSSAYNTRSSWVSSNTCSTRRTRERTYECDATTTGYIGGGMCKTTETYYESRPCTNSDYPYNGEISALENVKNRIASDLNTCITYVNNYVGMAGTYVQVATCNNKAVDYNSIYDFKTDASMSFSSSDGIEYVTLNVESENYSCSNCQQSNTLSTSESNTKNLYFFTTYYNKVNFANLVNSIDAGGSRERVITASANVTYTLPSGSVVEDKGNGNYTETNYNGFKISRNSLVGIKYDLQLFNSQLGHNNSFGSLLNNNGTYTCDYEVTETPTDECICPPGTDHEGENLYCLVADSGTTCIEAQIDYCNDSSIYIPEDCPGLLTCPNDITKNLSSCVNSGYDYSYCEELICNDSISTTYRCRNTNGVDGYMDITSCVYTKLAQGMTEQAAINECDALICPTVGNGLKIIYRTISLENPFPGKTISGGVANFNTDVEGRYPGTNWNSVDVVKNQILYSRENNYSSYGSKIYQNEEPLYTFVLNAATINKIRDYNDTHSYDDFLLDCKRNNSTACVSAFVHDSNLSGIIGGVCQNNTSQTNFYNCSDDE